MNQMNQHSPYDPGIVVPPKEAWLDMTSQEREEKEFEIIKALDDLECLKNLKSLLYCRIRKL